MERRSKHLAELSLSLMCPLYIRKYFGNTRHFGKTWEEVERADTMFRSWDLRKQKVWQGVALFKCLFFLSISCR
jgi:hypothetical protein